MFAIGWLELLVIALLCAAFLGLPAIALIVLLFYRRNANGGKAQYGRIPCPECGESIVAEARKCRFCGTDLIDETMQT